MFYFVFFSSFLGLVQTKFLFMSANRFSASNLLLYRLLFFSLFAVVGVVLAWVLANVLPSAAASNDVTAGDLPICTRSVPAGQAASCWFPDGQTVLDDSIRIIHCHVLLLFFSRYRFTPFFHPCSPTDFIQRSRYHYRVGALGWPLLLFSLPNCLF